MRESGPRLLLALLLGGCNLGGHARAQDMPPEMQLDRAPVDRVCPRTGVASDAPAVPKIVNGRPAHASQYPFQVAIVGACARENEEFKALICGGTLISERWVLTAAHCVRDTKEDRIAVVAGVDYLPGAAKTGKLRKRDTAQQQQLERFAVTRIIAHEAYNPETRDNDIALLQLIGPAPGRLSPVRLITADEQARLVAPGTRSTVIGWGATSEGGPASAQMMQVGVDVQDALVCERNYRSVIPSVRITGNMLCAGVTKGIADSCQGDSGGFLGITTTAQKRELIQVGIVSFGVGCARSGLFGVYTRVGNYERWIKQNQQ